ncbi:tyrosine phosphatase-like protein [Microdochium trichocladiopsis]|uniref:Very-long-chain (3R)-3-hydroxyacyl-CoA dehydratase n=1 Tax=Microdochium trichocladiopsis TaxID=1682393 RepID=A0A9P8XYZ4_9PEZI|nr:tyrosine phosphatase-like protein [Microdochium trichocladiopsis]KAH7026295.1 tyrosine phosphatase-like protein [Microdochium trichocladiopsis]
MAARAKQQQPVPKPDAAVAAKQPAAPAPAASAADSYLILYNSLSLLLWAYILYTTSQLLLVEHWPDLTAGNAATWELLHGFALTTESLAALEVLHAALGLVRASPLTTALQVAGRNTVLWAVARNYPDVMARGVGCGYAALLLAWSAAEVVRYSYFVVALLGKVQGGEAAGHAVPPWLVWIRYTMFIPLYPAGILSECWLIYHVIAPSRHRQAYYQYLLWFGLLIYIPASYILGTHMFAQRRKMLRGTSKAKATTVKRS